MAKYVTASAFDYFVDTYYNVAINQKFMRKGKIITSISTGTGTDGIDQVFVKGATELVDADYGRFYLLKRPSSTDDDPKYDKYMLVEGHLQPMGLTEDDLGDYYTKDDVVPADTFSTWLTTVKYEKETD